MNSETQNGWSNKFLKNQFVHLSDVESGLAEAKPRGGHESSPGPDTDEWTQLLADWQQREQKTLFHPLKLTQ